LVYLLVLFIPNSYTMLFWELYFLPFSVHVQTNIIYVAWLSLSPWSSQYEVQVPSVLCA
jgi:hypothetical protein